MQRYDLDQLGWYNFEWLAQTILKSEYGFAVEAWGSQRDYGRDAFSAVDLKSKKRESILLGPVVVQAKFVSRANAVGSAYWPNLKAACQGEARLIGERILKGLWDDPQTYLLVTNAPMTADEKAEVISIFSAHTNATVIPWGGGDVCDILDIFPEVARTFPQILTYRNLLSAIEHAQTKGVRERSQAALAGAQDILPVFVPTEAYDTAWTVVQKHHFVVLTGPPEMGKTSIGWMIAMAQLSTDWQVIECRSPQDIFDLFDSTAKQIFLADDAFGRTEFKPTKGEEWEADLSKVLQKIDPTHWLIWTSRKHILERAIRVMDLTGRARNYPAPAEVLVQADKLSQKEKALILYRHAVHAGLETAAKVILRNNLSTIVDNPHFTPERIRRFVREALPALAIRAKAGALKKEDVSTEVERAMKQYTEMMEKSYSRLSMEHKWLLTALLDEENVKSSADLERAFKNMFPGTAEVTVTQLLAELEESFLKTRQKQTIYVVNGEARWTRPIDWVHPSYRDLVIEKLNLDRPMRLRYLLKGGMSAISLALSQEGGFAGKREFPLLPDDESWDTLKLACTDLIETKGDSAINSILDILESLEVSNPWLSRKLDELVTSVCESSLQIWGDTDTRISGKILNRFFDVSSKSKAQIAAPPLFPSWKQIVEEVENGWSDEGQESHEVLTEELLDLAEFAASARENDPRGLKKLGFPLHYEKLLSSITEKANKDATCEIDVDDADSASSEAERLNVLAQAMKLLGRAVPERSEEFSDLSDRLRAQSDDYETVYFTLKHEEERRNSEDRESDHPYSPSPSAEIFNLSELFSDL